jgi:hypothetical protein
VIPLDATLIRGSHGLKAADLADRPLLIGHGAMPAEEELPTAAVRNLLLRALELEE